MKRSNHAQQEGKSEEEKRDVYKRQPYESFASYDETGASGFASSYILEKGEYLFHIGRNVRETEVAGKMCIRDRPR